jgi:hypothetical protein
MRMALPNTPDISDRTFLLVRSWLNLELPPRDYLLGDVLCTTSRWLIYGATGVGKTLFALEMAGAVASGSPFLNWDGRRPSRVMYLDGELPAETFKERMHLVAEQYGADIQLYGYSRDILGYNEMPPLNTEEGEHWLESEVRLMKPDAIFADSIMSLTIGNMSDEESWSPLKPLIRRLSARRVAQVWLHHTGHDTTKSYGSKTKEWELDTVLALTPAAEDGSAILADFTKARLRTPANRDQFKPRSLTRGPDGWIAEEATPSRKTTTGKSSEAAHLRKAVLSAYDALADAIQATPGFNGKPVRKVRVDALRQQVSGRLLAFMVSKLGSAIQSASLWRTYGRWPRPAEERPQGDTSHDPAIVRLCAIFIASREANPPFVNSHGRCTTEPATCGRCPASSPCSQARPAAKRRGL